MRLRGCAAEWCPQEAQRVHAALEEASQASSLESRSDLVQTEFRRNKKPGKSRKTQEPRQVAGEEESAEASRPDALPHDESSRKGRQGPRHSWYGDPVQTFPSGTRAKPTAYSCIATTSHSTSAHRAGAGRRAASCKKCRTPRHNILVQEETGTVVRFASLSSCSSCRGVWEARSQMRA